jgi:chromosome segregation ATPase
MTDKEPKGPEARGYPIPPPTVDPTVLTTQQLTQRMDALKELLTEKIEHAQDVLEQRADRNQSVCATNFVTIERQLGAIEAWRVEQKRDMNTAVDRALESAEKAVSKSETNSADQSRQQYATFAASLKGVSDTLYDVKDRVAKIEARTAGITEQRTDRRGEMGSMLAVLGGLFGLIGVVATIISIVVLLSK